VSNQTRLFALIVALGSTIAPTFAQQTVWIDGTGNWFTPANWSAGVPTSASAARINNGGTAQIAASGGMAGAVTLGFGAQDSGNLSVSGSGTLQTNGIMYLGEAGTGTLSITNGGVVSSGRFIIGDNVGSSGIATVSGSGSMWVNNVVCFVGYSGTATLNVTSGGTVSDSQASIGEAGGSNGTGTVDGAGSTWTQSGSVTVGGDGTGTLNITNRGTVLSTDPTFGGGVIGRNPGSSGMANVSGDGSNWTMHGPLSIADGFAGTTGTLQIMNGGAVADSYSVLGGSGGSGTATVSGAGSTWTNNGNLFVGSNNGSGMLTITQGGRVSSATGYIGFGSSSSNGTVDINGAGSTCTNSGNLYIGGNESGPQGTGVLRIESGGRVTATTTTVWGTGTLAIGFDPNLNGTLIFNGGTLRTIASTTFANNASLTGSGVTIDSNGFNLSLSGIFSGAGGLTKTGSDRITPTNTNTYTGMTMVNGGRLVANNPSGSGTGTGPVTVNNGGSLLGGTGTISGPVTVNSGAALLGGDGTTASSSLTVANNLLLNAGSIIQLVLGPSGTHSSLMRTGGTWSFATNQAFTFINFGAGLGVYNNIITGLAGDPGGEASWTITNAGFTGTFSYDGAGNIDLNITAVPPPPPVPQSAFSRKTHGAAGTFDIPLPLTGNVGIECRSGGATDDYQMIINFANSVTVGGGSVISGTGRVSSFSVSGSQVTVNLTSVADAQRVTVLLSNVNDGTHLGDVPVSMGVLIGDVNGNAVVNATDVALTKSQVGMPVGSSNFREDVNANGTISATDVALVKSEVGTALPP
jgi:T5SS/PEP-CTERM-associated repeat protein/autotransporter-associated beta strand protein